MSLTSYFMEATYLVASILFILALKGMSRPETARRGMFLAEGGMLAAIIGTLVGQHIVTWGWIIAGLTLGSLIGAWMAVSVPMTAMPQRTALSHAVGAFAAALVGVGEFLTHGAEMGAITRGALGFEVMLGALTTTGSLIAAGKLQGIIGGKPIQFRGQNAINLIIALAMTGSFAFFWMHPETVAAFYAMLGLAFVFGVMLVIPIGSADMPVVISIYNALTGLAVGFDGFVLDNAAMIIAGTVVGAAGTLLTQLMAKAMNRSLANVLFANFGETSAAGGTALTGAQKTIEASDAGVMLAFSQKVIVVPGYGMAVAQAQHKVWELCQLLLEHGVKVKFAIHPVAGRMPGHMNVLLAEAGVPYELISDLDEINAEFDTADVALIIGANDVVNPDARTNSGSPIFGMPLLNADKAKNVIVIKRGQGQGFSGIDNALFVLDQTRMLYGDAQSAVGQLIQAVKAAG